MSRPNDSRPLTPINNLFFSSASSKNPNYQEIITKMTSHPKLTKILKKTNTSIKDVQFITFQQFLDHNQLRQLPDDYFDRNDHLERYETELQRRKKQLQILLQMEHKYFQKTSKNSSTQKSSRCQIQTPKHKNYQTNSYHMDKEFLKDRKTAKQASQSHRYEFEHLHSRKSSLSRRKMSLASSRYSRQHSINRVQNYKRIKEVQIIQTYTEGRPYIKEYQTQLKNRMSLFENQRLKTMPSTSRQKVNRKSSKVGKIQKQIIQNDSAQEEYQNSLTDKNNKKPFKHNEACRRKSTKRQFQDNEYAMIPIKKDKIKQRMSHKVIKNKQRQVVKELITEVKRYEEINQNYMKKLKSIDRNDKKSRDKLFEASSKDKFEKKENIEKLKNRITSKSSRKNVRY